MPNRKSRFDLHELMPTQGEAHAVNSAYWGERAHWRIVYAYPGWEGEPLHESNHRCVLRELGGEGESVAVESSTFMGNTPGIVRILVNPTDWPRLRKAARIVLALQDHPALDEDDLAEAEEEAAETVWRDCYDPRERLAEVRDYARDAGDSLRLNPYWPNVFRMVRDAVRGDWRAASVLTSGNIREIAH